MTLDIIVGILGGGSLIALITFLIKRGDEKKEKKDEVLNEIKGIKKQMQKMERDNVRTQLLLLMNTYQYGDAKEIMICAEYYFKKKEDGGLEGDWYLTSLFQRFCEREQIPLPPWFSKGE